MKKDIEFPEVSDVGLAAVRLEKEEGVFWEVYILNRKEHAITNVLIATKGYGKQGDRDVETSLLRHYFEEVPARSHVMVELIPHDLRGITNEFWVSFYIDRSIYDKKFLFLPDTLLDQNLTAIPGMDKKGILIL